MGEIGDNPHREYVIPETKPVRPAVPEPVPPSVPQHPQTEPAKTPA